MGIWWVYNSDWMMGIEKTFHLNSIPMSYNRSFQSRASQDPAYESGPAGPAMIKSPSQQIPAGCWCAAGLGILRSKNGWHKDMVSMDGKWMAWNPHPIAHQAHQIDWFLRTSNGSWNESDHWALWGHWSHHTSIHLSDDVICHSRWSTSNWGWFR